MTTTIQIILALLPFAVLFAGFLIFKLDAFKASLYAWILELVIVLVYYGMSPVRTIEASLWGALKLPTYTRYLQMDNTRLIGRDCWVHPECSVYTIAWPFHDH